MQVVFGASGRAGGEAARALIERGDAVRVVVRRAEQAGRWTALGAQVALADMLDTDAVTAALQGASGVFAINPTPLRGDPYRHAEAVGTALASALRQARVPKVVALSSIGAQHVSGTGIVATLNQFERLLDGAAPAIAFLRAGYFVETWSEVADAAASEGVLPTFLEPNQKIPMVSTIDVGRLGAALLGENGTEQRIVELSGPEDWSASDVARAFSRILERPVAPHFVPPQERAGLLARDGVDGDVAEALLGMYDGIARGRLTRQEGNEQRRGSVSLTDAIERLISALRPA